MSVMLWLGSTPNCGSRYIYYAKEYMGKFKKNVTAVSFLTAVTMLEMFVFLALQPFGCIFHSPVAGFSLLIFEVSWSHTTMSHSL